ncbi:MAG: UpxY family transcription antiterminator [Acidobacteria bacterium]|nr:UpxY family transcription antiterminator [Acidobacteriota bacterium]
MSLGDEQNFTQNMADFPGAVQSDQFLRWYVVYTCARHEKVIARHFEERGLAYFLPLYQETHRWNKREARVSLPLFPGYIFVQTAIQDRYRPLQVPGVLHYVGSGSTPTPIPEDEIDTLRQVLIRGKDVVPHPYLSAGCSVRISSGPMAGLSGIIERTKSGSRFIVTVEMIKRSIAIELDGFQIVPVRSNPSLPVGRPS